jgi:mannose-6-phosphate isomerase-like protein (cupin superfamily)
MANTEIKNARAPDEVRPFEGKGHIDVMKLQELSVARAIFEPGWKWSNNVKPIMGTKSCEVAHFGYCVSGRMHVKMDDGKEYDIGPGDFFRIEPGHDAWVVGDQAVEMVDFAGDEHQYAKRREAARKHAPEARPSK